MKSAITRGMASSGVLKPGFTSWLSDDLELEDAFRLLSSAGCESVEIAGNPECLSQSESIGLSLRHHGLSVVAVSAGVPFARDRSLSLHAEVESSRSRSVEYVKSCVDLASQLGARIVYVCSIARAQRPHEESLRLLSLSLRSCADYAEEADVVLALEPFPTGEIPSAREAGNLIRKIGSKNLGLLLDTGHLVISREPLAGTAKEWKDILAHVHINNNDGVGDLHWPPQRGRLTKEDFRGLLVELKSGYGGSASVELRNPEHPASTVAASMKYVESLAPRGL